MEGDNGDDVSDALNKRSHEPRRTSMWFGNRVPREEMVFVCQISVVLIVVVASIYNLSVGTRDQSELWTALLSSCLGYILPNPRLKPN